MRVLMLGWEFPPFISGGLGTACFGLTRAMSRMGTEVLFVLPKAVDAEYTEHVRLISPQAAPGTAPMGSAEQLASTYEIDEFSHVEFKAIPSRITSPYNRPKPDGLKRNGWTERHVTEVPGGLKLSETGEPIDDGGSESPGAKDVDYSNDILSEVQRYASMCTQLVRGAAFDVIHAHDWMTYPAGLAVAAMSGKPLVVHVHSTEFDRAGENVNQTIYDIERRGMHGAMKVMCVSYLTRNIAARRYAVPEERLAVCYNGIESNGPVEPNGAIRRTDKIVLFLGRITMQKGPEFFVAAAKKVLEKCENVKFVMAGNGDMWQDVVVQAAELGIGHKFTFTGFLRGNDVERVFRMADVYVMPSVSEPFGIAPLEAISHDVPVIISKQSGVSEILTHALKVDFWDTDDMASKILAVLRHDPLRRTLRQHGQIEVQKLSWLDSAKGLRDIYEQVASEA